MGPDPVPDDLAYTGADGLLPLSEFVDILDGGDLPSQEARKVLLKNLELHRKHVEEDQNKARSLFLANERFYVLLASRIDGSVMDEVRHKLARRPKNSAGMPPESLVGQTRPWISLRMGRLSRH